MTITTSVTIPRSVNRAVRSRAAATVRAAVVGSSLVAVSHMLAGPCLRSAQAQSPLMRPAATQEAASDLAPFGPNVIPVGQLPLGPGDLVDVNVFNTPELSGRLRVGQTGKLELPVGGSILVEGLTPVEASAAIEKQLRDGQIMLDPHVNIQITQFATQGITVIGEVRSPGPYPWYGPHTLYDALALAGGPTVNEGSNITITRHADPTNPISVPVNTPKFSEMLNSTPVYPGDVVYVNPADLVYVVGDVNSPGPIAIAQGRDLTLLKVIGLCHGWTLTADVNKATIIRKTTSGTIAIPVDINGVMKNRSPDIVLQASDTLVMPHSAFKRFLTYLLPAATNAGTSATAIALEK